MRPLRQGGKPTAIVQLVDSECGPTAAHSPTLSIAGINREKSDDLSKILNENEIDTWYYLKKHMLLTRHVHETTFRVIN